MFYQNSSNCNEVKLISINLFYINEFLNTLFSQQEVLTIIV